MFHVKHGGWVGLRVSVSRETWWVAVSVGKRGVVFHVKRGCVGVGEMRLWKVGLCFSSC